MRCWIPVATVAWLLVSFGAVAAIGQEQQPAPAPPAQGQVMDAAQGSPDALGEPAEGGTCGDLARVDCDRAGRSFLIAAVAYGILSLLIACLSYWFLSTRGTFTQTVNFFVPMFTFAVVATVLVALDPARDGNFLSCIACPDYQKAILLSGVAAWPRGILLGGLPVLALYFVTVVIWNRMGK